MHSRHACEALPLSPVRISCASSRAPLPLCSSLLSVYWQLGMNCHLARVYVPVDCQKRTEGNCCSASAPSMQIRPGLSNISSLIYAQFCGDHSSFSFNCALQEYFCFCMQEHKDGEAFLKMPCTGSTSSTLARLGQSVKCELSTQPASETEIAN